MKLDHLHIPHKCLCGGTFTKFKSYTLKKVFWEAGCRRNTTVCETCKPDAQRVTNIEDALAFLVSRKLTQ